MLYNIDRDPADPVGHRPTDTKEPKEAEAASENASE